MTMLTAEAAAKSLAVARVALTVHDLERVARFYRAVVGLTEIAGDASVVRLGAGGATLLELRRDPAARRRSPAEAGLFHTAFLLPSRADLGAWVEHARASRAPVSGASDHRVSEALYLADPEGNGVEIYADRPPASWRQAGGGIEMITEPLDLADLAAAAEGPWRGAPAGTIVGHVHLQVGRLAEAEAFYAGTLGLDVTARYPGAAFYSADGYHHHVGTNVWNSRGAGPRNLPSTGLSELVLRLETRRLAAVGAKLGRHAGDGLILDDPWGTPVRLAPA